MRTFAVLLAFSTLAWLGSPTVLSQTASGSGAMRTREVHERAAKDPFGETAFKAYLDSLPREGEFYVLEGDILATEPEVRAYLVGRSTGETRSGIRPELIVNLREGRRDYYALPADRVLPYYVDRASFIGAEDRYRSVVTAVARAAAGWQAACPSCGVVFRPVDGPPAGSDALRGFVVRQVDVDGAYIAAAFFPGDPPARRVLRIDRTFFVTPFDPVGVIRHELGHVLGYRHEHTRGIPGCGFEDNRWLPLTPYDPHSVMHYFCGGAGSINLALTDIDIRGHRALYGQRASPPPPVTAPPGSPSPASETLRRFDEARVSPFDLQKREAFLKALPRVGDYYIVEGDVRMTEPEVVQYLIARGESEQAAQSTPELIVNLHGGRPDYYPPGQRLLAYEVDRASFPSVAKYEVAVQALAAATREWEALCETCGVRFKPLTAADSDPPSFTVRHFDAGGDYIAAAFFPHDPPARRFVDIDPSFFTTSYDRVGVLRHELGHVLGYRHEHIRGVPGCYREDNQWRPLTPYDPHSVMHYYCGGGGNLKFELTAVDKIGHAKLYSPPVQTPSGAPPGGAPSDPGGDLVISLEGGEIVDNAAEVLRVLLHKKLLPIAAHTVASGDTIETLYRGKLGLPAHSEAMTRFAGELNGRDFSGGVLRIGDVIKYPALRFVEDAYGLRGSAKSASQIEKEWRSQVIRDTAKAKESATKEGSTAQTERFQLRRYVLRLHVDDGDRLLATRRAVNALGSLNIVVSVDQPPRKKEDYFASRAQPQAPRTYLGLRQFCRDSGNVKAGEQGTILSLLSVNALEGKRSCLPAGNCPDVILVDTRLFVHPDLREAVTGDNLDRSSENEALVSQSMQTCHVVNWDQAFHATHLAGIVAARDNDFGLVGVDPDARVLSWDWDALAPQQSMTLRKIGLNQAQASSRGAMQIYLFATGWDVEPPLTRVRRVTDDSVARALYQEQPLVVVAAGQGPTPGDAQEVTWGMRKAPMNLGDLPNILVVTACDPCEGPNAALMDIANFSLEFVHVAAPGRDVLSTAPGGDYSLATGTSQSAAFVAGLASAMVSRYPLLYKEAFQVKVRLQVTATPLELIGRAQDGRTVASGVVDPVLATRDPSKDWLKRLGGDWEEVAGPGPGDGVAWRSDDIRLEVDGTPRIVPLDSVWRLSRRDNRWVAYVGQRHGPVEKIGPGTLDSTHASRVLLRHRGIDIQTSGIEDIVLRHPTSGR